jgi:superfamily II DNA helicase RecQ
MCYVADDAESIQQGKYQIVQLSPEALFHGKWRDVMTTSVYRERVKVLAVDEAHCVVQW